MGEYTAWVNGDLQTFSDNPCAPGLEFINGNCFRAPGTQDTTYGPVAIPLAGPVENLTIAAQAYGPGTTCATERVDVGPYAYEQNVCRNAAGSLVGSADLMAETLYVRNQLNTLGQPVAPQVAPPVPASTVRLATNNLPGNPQPVQTATTGTPVGGAVQPGAQVAVSTGAAPGGFDFGVIPTNWWMAAAAGVGLLFILPALSGGRG